MKEDPADDIILEMSWSEISEKLQWADRKIGEKQETREEVKQN